MSAKIYVVGTQKNRLNETVLLSTHYKCYNWWIRKYSQFGAQKLCLSWAIGSGSGTSSSGYYNILGKNTNTCNVFWAITIALLYAIIILS